MSIWSRENCVLTALGNEALTEISAKGGRMTFDSVWTCGTRVEPEELYDLTALPDKRQKMTLVRYNQVSGGYSINVQITNEGLTSPYAIEMVGVYMKLDGFNEGNPFLYLVLLTDEGSADQMTNVSRSTYKYAIYLYHTNKGVLNINLNPTDYVATDTYEAGIRVLEDEIKSVIFHTTFTPESIDNNGVIRLYTENNDTTPFISPSQNPVTAYPLVVIHNYNGYLSDEVDVEVGGNVGVYIDDVGPFKLQPYDLTTKVEHKFTNADLICTVLDDNTIKVNNHYLGEDFIPKDHLTYSDFNDIPFEEGIYNLVGNAENSPKSFSDTVTWTCIVIATSGANMMFAKSSDFADNKLYVRSCALSANSWVGSTAWKYIGGGSGIQTATATFVTSTGTASPSNHYMRITRDNTSEALKAGDVIACTLTAKSTLKTGSTVDIKFLDSSTVSKFLYKPDAMSSVPCCQVPKHFLLKYDDNGNFIMLTPLDTTTTLSTSDPGNTDGKFGDIWYTY